MTNPQLQELIAAVRRQDKVGIFRALIKPMLADGTPSRTFEMLALILATPKGNINRNRIGLLEYLADLGAESPAMVSELSIKRAIKPFGRWPEKGEEDDETET